MMLVLVSCKDAPTLNQNSLSTNNIQENESEQVKSEALKRVTIGREAYETIGKEYEEPETRQISNIDSESNKDDSREDIVSKNVKEESEETSKSAVDEKKEEDETDKSTLALEGDDNIDIIDIEEIVEEAEKSGGKKKNYLDIDYHTTDPIIERKIYLDKKARFATFSEISDGSATLYIVNKKVVDNFKNKIVAVNAGHGTVGGTRKRTYSHPDYTPKVAGGTNKQGSIFSAAVSDGTILLDGKQEATANLMVAVALKEKLLNEGYSVLMIREDKDCRLDNIARTVIANENADIHIAIHFDSTERDKGIFYMKPINNKQYLSMEPLKSNVDNINRLGECLIEAFKEKEEKVWKGIGYLEGDLTQLAFSTNASVDIELGDRATFLDEERAKKFADGLLLGIEKYFALTP